jgi:hypothetical protein
LLIQPETALDCDVLFVGLLTAVALKAVITDALKDGLGFPRPDFYARCFGSVTATPVSLLLSCVKIHSSPFEYQSAM